MIDAKVYALFDSAGKALVAMQPGEAEELLAEAAAVLSMTSEANRAGLEPRIRVLERLVEQGAALTAARMKVAFPESSAYTSAGAPAGPAPILRFVAEA